MTSQFRNSNRYKTAALLFALGGLILIVFGIADIVFLPIGVALAIIGLVIWQRRGS